MHAVAAFHEAAHPIVERAEVGFAALVVHGCPVVAIGHPLRRHPCAQVVFIVGDEDDMDFAARVNLKQNLTPRGLAPAAKPEQLPPDPWPIKRTYVADAPNFSGEFASYSLMIAS